MVKGPGGEAGGRVLAESVLFRERLWDVSAGGRAGFDGFALAAGTDLDALALGVLCLGQQALQPAVLDRGLDRVGHHMGGEGDRAAEGAVAALDPVVLRLGGVVEGPLTLDGQQAVVEGDGEVVALDPWQLDADKVSVLARGDVQRGGPDRGGVDGCALSLAVPAERVGEQAVDLVAGALVLDVAEVLERVPPGGEHHLVLPLRVGRSGGRRLGDNAVRVREAGFTGHEPYWSSASRRCRLGRATSARRRPGAVAMLLGSGLTPLTRRGTGVQPSHGSGWLQLSSRERAGQLAGAHGEGPGAPGGQVQLAGVLEVGQEVLFESGDHARVAEGDVELVVERERAVVEVD